MVHVQPLATVVRRQVADALTSALAVTPAPIDVDPQLRRSDRADFQANGVLGLAKRTGDDPRELAGRVRGVLAEGAADGGPIGGCEVSGPGFLNLTLDDAALVRQLAARAADPRLGIAPWAGTGTTVIDYSQPNIAKEMHVGHLRSTVIGDALVRILEFGGERVIRRNHLGDWGTQFGMLIQYLEENPEPATEAGTPSMSRLDRIYKASRIAFDSDPAFAERARRRVVALQAGDPGTVAAWQGMVDESKRCFEAVYARLGVLLVDADAVGESHYNPALAAVCADLEEAGVAVPSEGALCVFFEDVKGVDGQPVPLIVRKSDGGYGYAATDLAAVRDRVGGLGADRLLYVVDARQALHFRMVFATARRAGLLPDGVSAEHLPFGTVLGKDGKPFKTRSGSTVRLMDLLDEAVERARAVIVEKNPELAGEELEERARQVAIGAVKYADLSTSRTRDYVFDVDRMVSLTGDTGVYLQYAHARIRSILRKAPADLIPAAHPELALEPAERALALQLDQFDETLAAVRETAEPHRLCGYLYALATAYTAFHEHCPVLKASSRAVAENRLMLCRLTAATLELGMGLLGIDAPERL